VDVTELRPLMSRLNVGCMGASSSSANRLEEVPPSLPKSQQVFEAETFKPGLSCRLIGIGWRRTRGRYFNPVLGSDHLSSGIGLGLTLGLICTTRAEGFTRMLESATLEI